MGHPVRQEFLEKMLLFHQLIVLRQGMQKKTDWKLKPSVIIIHYGDPIKSNQYNDYTIQELSNYVKKELQKLIAEG